MAWVDDRAWCHPKLVGLSDRAFRVWVNGISYSAGMGTRGVLSPAQQKLLGSSKKIAEELVKASVWETSADDDQIRIKDWDEHNGKRDERRAQDRERKRKSRGQSAGQSQGHSAGTAHVDRVTSDRVTTTAEGPTAAAVERLKVVGWSKKQISEALPDLERAVAWLDHATDDPNVHSPGALAWQMFKQGGLPEQPKEPQSTLAAGAVGTRSILPKPNFTCPECGVGFRSESAYEDHLANVHGELVEASA